MSALTDLAATIQRQRARLAMGGAKVEAAESKVGTVRVSLV